MVLTLLLRIYKNGSSSIPNIKNCFFWLEDSLLDLVTFLAKQSPNPNPWTIHMYRQKKMEISHVDSTNHLSNIITINAQKGIARIFMKSFGCGHITGCDSKA